MTMNKADLVEVIKEIGSYDSKADAERALLHTLAAVAQGLKTEGGIRLIGFGTFEVVERKKRKGRNPRTGEEITIPASKGVKFKAGANLKDTVATKKKKTKAKKRKKVGAK